MTKIKLTKQKLKILEEIITSLEYRKPVVDQEWMTTEENEESKQFNKMIDELIAQIEELA